MAKDTRLAIVIPCYNEEGLIFSTTDRLIDLMDDLISREKISPESYIYLVNDGSKDKTWYEIRVSCEKYKGRVKAAKFSRNFGNQKALLAGMLGAYNIGCDAVVTIDADLQQRPELILRMIDILNENEQFDSVAAFQEVRKEGKVLTFFKDTFYKVINSMSTVPFVQGASDFRTFRRNRRNR